MITQHFLPPLSATEIRKKNIHRRFLQSQTFKGFLISSSLLKSSSLPSSHSICHIGYDFLTRTQFDWMVIFTDFFCRSFSSFCRNVFSVATVRATSTAVACSSLHNCFTDSSDCFIFEVESYSATAFEPISQSRI